MRGREHRRRRVRAYLTFRRFGFSHAASIRFLKAAGL